MKRLYVIVGVVLAVGLFLRCTGSDTSDDEALVERTCEIFRDIAGDAGNVDTLAETRKRLKDLYDGYGTAAPPEIQGPLRDMVSAVTQGDVDSLGNAVDRMDVACSNRGY
jgi:hypothetical protein